MRPPAEHARLDAPPRLDVPGIDLALAPTPVTPGPGALTLPPPPSLPIRTSISDNPAPSGSAADRIAGDPANVLALSASSMPLREFVSVPPGNQVGRTPGAVPGGTLAGAAEEGANGAAGNVGGPGGPPEVAPALPPGAAPANAAAAAPSAPPPRAAATASVLAIESTRKDFPTDGVFDVVVQSAGPESLQESTGVLSGKPVYSVYLQVGGRRDWILQYCVPASDAAAPVTSGPVVRLGGPGRLTAPYPLVTYRPPIAHYGSKYLMLHGFVNADGRFQDLHAIGAHDPADAALAISVLSRWEFRPAAQDGKRVRVETLLAIPAGE
jgi:hypothetical protein